MKQILPVNYEKCLSGTCTQALPSFMVIIILHRINAKKHTSNPFVDISMSMITRSKEAPLRIRSNASFPSVTALTFISKSLIFPIKISCKQWTIGWSESLSTTCTEMFFLVIELCELLMPSLFLSSLILWTWKRSLNSKINI